MDDIVGLNEWAKLKEKIEPNSLLDCAIVASECNHNANGHETWFSQCEVEVCRKFRQTIMNAVNGDGPNMNFEEFLKECKRHKVRCVHCDGAGKRYGMPMHEEREPFQMIMESYKCPDCDGSGWRIWIAGSVIEKLLDELR